jgi:nucleotide-binding universal stress UspA family protein
VANPKIMVALRDAESVETLVSLAAQLSNGMDAELVALHVVEVPRVTPLEAEDEVIDHAGKEILAKAEQVATKFSKKVSLHLVRARNIGDAIVAEAKNLEVDLLVMGHHKPHPHPLGELLLGSTVQYVTRHAPCRVIVEIPPPSHR